MLNFVTVSKFITSTDTFPKHDTGFHCGGSSLSEVPLSSHRLGKIVNKDRIRMDGMRRYFEKVYKTVSIC